MNARRRTYTAALAGAAVLASGAYAIGSAQGGGNASAASKREAGEVGWRAAGPPGPPPPGARGMRFHAEGPPIGALAGKLGVTPRELRAALRDIRPPRPPHGGPKDLADALGVSEKQLMAAFDKLRDDHGDRDHGDDLAALADALGVSQSDLRDAFEKTRPKPGKEPQDPVKAIADALGKSEADVRAAFDRVHEAREAKFAADLADALGKDPADVKAALDKERLQHEDREKETRDAFAKALADRLDIPESKVRDALESLPHPGPPQGLHGPPGPPPPAPPGPPPYGP
jgi:transcriptional regulator with XRE-family HTH domain